MKRWAVFLSGRGSTAQALMDLAENIDIAVVISNKSKAVGLTRARRMGIATLFIDKSTAWAKIHQQLSLRKVDRIFLLGFMKLIPADFVEKWQGRIFNIHPSLLPKYPGLHAMESSFKDKAEMGITIHHVVAQMDAGPVVLKHKVFKKAQATDFSVVEIRMAAAEQRLIREMGLRL